VSASSANRVLERKGDDFISRDLRLPQTHSIGPRVMNRVHCTMVSLDGKRMTVARSEPDRHSKDCSPVQLVTR
jgi:hypothetical protein